MDSPASRFGDLDVSQLDSIGHGSFSQVAVVRGASDLVVKIPFNAAYEYHEREKQVYERLGRHPFILQCHGEATISVPGSEPPMRGLLLQYHAAGTVAEKLAAGEVPSAAKRTAWLTQAVEAVRHVHSRGIVHGDVGCHNLLIQHDATLALADFGGARIDGSACLAFAPARYTQPASAAQGLEPTERDDVFALGTVLHELCAGALLFHGVDDGRVAACFAARQYPVGDAVPPAVRRVIHRCWDGAYADGAGVARDLRAALGHDDGRRWSPSASCVLSLGVLLAASSIVLAANMRRWNLSRLFFGLAQTAPSPR